MTVLLGARSILRHGNPQSSINLPLSYCLSVRTKWYYEILWKVFNNNREPDYQQLSRDLDHSVIKIILEWVKEIMDEHHVHGEEMKSDPQSIIYLCEEIVKKDDSGGRMDYEWEKE